MQSVVIESILWQGRQEGAIFNARAHSGDKYRFVAGVNAMPRPPVAGEVWDIEGTICRHPDFGEQVEREVSPRHLPTEHLDLILAVFSAQTGLILNEAQRKAVSLAAASPVACITGGAGVGKTAVLKAIHLSASLHL